MKTFYYKDDRTVKYGDVCKIKKGMFSGGVHVWITIMPVKMGNDNSLKWVCRRKEKIYTILNDLTMKNIEYIGNIVDNPELIKLTM